MIHRNLFNNIKQKTTELYYDYLSKQAKNDMKKTLRKYDGH